MYTSTCMCIKLEVCHRNFRIGKQYFVFLNLTKDPILKYVQPLSLEKQRGL